MKKLIFAAALFVGLSSMAFAQQDSLRKQKRTPEQRAQLITDGLSKKLSLTDDQKSKIYTINLDRAQKMEELRAKGTRPDKSKINDFRASAEASDQQILAVLNNDQKKIYTDLKAKRQENAGRHRQHKPEAGKKEIK